MMTPKEAADKFCPQSIIKGAAGPCISTSCMAWRWRRRYADDEKESKIQHATGYCGLAGKP